MINRERSAETFMALVKILELHAGGEMS